MDTAAINQLPIEDLHRKRVLVRIDVDDGEYLTRGSFSPWRLQNCLATLKYLLGTESRIILATQLGDAVGRWEESLVLDPLAEELSLLLDRPVRKPSAMGTEVFRAVMGMNPQDVVLLENLGFHSGEETNDPEFARQLGSLAEIYCNESFPVADRALASTVGITRFVPVSVAGLEMAREISTAEAVLDRPDLPYVALIGGRRLEEKLPLVEQLCRKVTRIFIGGAICFTFMKAQKQETGAAQVDEDLLPYVEQLLKKAEGKTEILLPNDFVVVEKADWKRFEESGRRASPPPFATVAAKDLLSSHVPVDVGPQSRRRAKVLIDQARTLLWNGPLGIWEVEPFGAGTREIALHLIERASSGLRCILCGDSLGHAIRDSGLPLEPIRHMTPAGEAILRLLTGYPLPAVEALAKEADLTIPAHSQTRRVLLPVDGSEQSLEVVRKAASLLNVNGTEIHLLHVWKPAIFANRWVKPEQRRRQEIQLRLEADRIFALSNAILARYGAISHHQTILKGDRAECIEKYADEIGADLMAVECEGLAGPLRKFLRNSSYKIVESTKCPVFVVRVPDEEGAT